MRRIFFKVLLHFRKSLNCFEWTISRDLYLEDITSEGPEEDKRHVIGNWNKENPCYLVAEILATLYLAQSQI